MKRSLSVVALSAAALLAVCAPAAAHVTVGPEEVAAGDYATLTVSVPTEKETPTTEVRVEVPEGFVLSGVQPVPGWEHAFEERGGVVTAVIWSGGEIGAREFQQFLLQAQAPESPGEYAWPATQTYGDGSVVRWTGPPDAAEPAPVVRVVAGGGHADGGHAEGGETASAHEGTAAGTLATTGGASLPVYVALGAGAALAAGILLLRRLRAG